MKEKHDAVPKIEEIIRRAQEYLPSLDAVRVARAYEFAAEAHANQTRYSGEPYIIHPLNVARIILDYHPDENTLIAALLHDVSEDTSRTLDDIEKHFGKDIRNVVAGLEKLSIVKHRPTGTEEEHALQAENLRRLFLAMAKDFRVVLIKLCDRLHNMRTLQYVPEQKRARIAHESLDVYSQIAARLGIYRIKSEMEDLCFQWLQPEMWDDITRQLRGSQKFREQHITYAIETLNEMLRAEGFQAELSGRLKTKYSIYCKMQKKGKTAIDEIFDVFAIRIVIADAWHKEKEFLGNLYTVLGLIHSRFTPLAQRFKDYIAVPKINGYRSLHTTVLRLGRKHQERPTEIQIRSNSMHHQAEFGVASHWIYKDESAHATAYVGRQMEWLKGLSALHDIKEDKEFLENLKVDAFQDRIFVLTPRGDVKDLPAEATPVDFAYAVHTEVGNRCVLAKVNGNIVSLNHPLRSGDVVEIVTRNNSHPSQNWLTFVKTRHAKDRIRAYMHASYATQKNTPEKPLAHEIAAQNLKRKHKGITHPDPSGKRDVLIVGGATNVFVSYARCCSPKPADVIIGYTTRGAGVTIHRADCSMLSRLSVERLIEAVWSVDALQNIPDIIAVRKK